MLAVFAPVAVALQGSMLSGPAAPRLLASTSSVRKVPLSRSTMALSPPYSYQGLVPLCAAMEAILEGCGVGMGER